MTGAVLLACVVAISPGAAPQSKTSAPPANTPPKFAASDIHTSPAVPLGTIPPRLRVVPVYDDRYEIDNATLPDLIGQAWGFPNDKITGGPPWLEMDHFDVIAKFPNPPADISPEDQKRMLQVLLAERFKLVAHKDTRPVPGYVLTSLRKPALKAAAKSQKSGCVPSYTPGGKALFGNADGGAPVNFTIGTGSTITYNCRNVTVAAFAQGMHGMFGTGLGPGPVLDATGLKGAWDFDLKWTLDYVHLDNTPARRVTIFDALNEELGLTMTEGPVPAPVLVVDSVSRTPTANVPDLARVMPPIPPVTRFDVASVKPSDAGSSRSGIHVQPGGRFTAEGITMTGLFQLAFSGHSAENMPKWTDSDRFDIVARTPPGTAPLDRATWGPPLQALLRERFKLAWHTEQRPGNAYVIDAVKPKLKKADPAGRTSCSRDMAPYGAQGKSQRFTCRNITMAQFADWLAKGNGIGLTNLISDGTGLSGGWDFTLVYDPEIMQQTPPNAEAGVASDPTAGYSIFEAMEKQLGLKLRTTKGLRPVMVIDHIEEKPINP